MQLSGKPPRIVWVKNVAVQNPNTKSPVFTIEGDAVVPGTIKVLVETAYKINWPAYNWTRIDLELYIVCFNRLIHNLENNINTFI